MSESETPLSKEATGLAQYIADAYAEDHWHKGIAEKIQEALDLQFNAGKEYADAKRNIRL